jgi:hypothetical protein
VKGGAEFDVMPERDHEPRNAGASLEAEKVKKAGKQILPLEPAEGITSDSTSTLTLTWGDEFQTSVLQN